MAPDDLAIIVTISVLGGLILIALLVVCIVKICANHDLERRFANTQHYGDTVALQEVGAPPSYVHYPAPEPYTPAPYDPEDNPWRLGPYNDLEHEEYNPIDTHDHPTYPDPALQIPRRSSHPLDPPYRRSSVQNMPRRPSHVQDYPRRSSYVEGMHHKPSSAKMVPRSRHSYAPEIPPRATRRPSYSYSTQEPSSSQKNKLWYYYLKEDPNYFTSGSLEWNKKQPRLWKPANKSAQLSAPVHAPQRRDSDVRQHQHQQHQHQHQQQQHQQQNNQHHQHQHQQHQQQQQQHQQQQQQQQQHQQQQQYHHQHQHAATRSSWML